MAKQQPNPADSQAKVRIEGMRQGTWRLLITCVTALIAIGIIAFAVVRIAEKPNNDPPWLKITLVILGPIGAWGLWSKTKELIIDVLVKRLHRWVETLPSKANNDDTNKKGEHPK